MYSPYQISSVKSKKQQFAKQIRKKQINQIFARKRKQLLTQYNQKDATLHQFQLIQNQLILLLQSELSQFGFTLQTIRNNPYFIVDLILEIRENLIRVSFKNSTIINDIDQKLLPSSNSQFELDEVPLPKQYSLKLQTLIFTYLNDDIYNHQGKYKQLPKEKQSKMITFWIDYLKRNKYIQTAQHKQYHFSLIDSLSLFITEIESPDLRETILSWVQGTQSLTLIFNSFFETFIDCHKHSKIYDIILKGLKMDKFQIKSNAIDVLHRCIRVGDYDDIVQLLKFKSQILTELIQFFNNEPMDSMKQTEQGTNCLIKAAYCVTIFLSTYDELILDCVKQGAGYVGAKLIMSQNLNLIKQGFQIFINIASIQDKHLKKSALQLLLNTSSVQSTLVWQRIGKSDYFFNHWNLDIKNCFVEFICTFVANSELQEVISLWKNFDFQNMSLTEILIDMFKNNDDRDILLNILKVFHTLFYYYLKHSSQQVEDVMKIDQWGKNLKYAVEQDLMMHLGVNKIKQNGMILKLQQLYQKQNIDSELKQQIDIMLYSFRDKDY